MTVTYTINHAISPELETWLASQPDFVSIDIQPTSTNVYYDHASGAEETAFKELLAKQIGLADDNVNTADPDLARTTLVGPQTFDDDVSFNGDVEFFAPVQFDEDVLFTFTIGIDNNNIALGVGAGTKIGTGPTQKLAFYGATPIAQPAANADTSGATLGQLETEVNELKALLRSLGLMAT